LILHETQQDRRTEARIVEAVAAKHGFGTAFCSKAYPVDSMFMRGRKPVCFVEARHRNNAKDKYPTFMWSLQKFIHAKQFAEVLPTVLLVEWEEGIFSHRINGDHYEIGYVNRTGTTGRTSADNEPVIEIPTDKFKEEIPREYEW
jgi:hypothetical protein